MFIHDLLRTKGNYIVSIHPDKTLFDCIKLFNEKRVSALIVLDEKSNFLGIISDRDVLRTAFTVKEKMFDVPVRNVMTSREKVLTATEENNIADLMEIMTNNRIRHLPITDGEQIVGVVSIGDVVKAQLDETTQANSQMQNYIMGHYA